MIVITIARKPINSSVVDNVIQWGTGGLNLDESRVSRVRGPLGSGVWGTCNATVRDDRMFNSSPDMREWKSQPHVKGRFPSNIVFEHKPQCRNLGFREIPGNRVDTRPDGDGGRTSKDLWRFRPTDATRRGYSDENGMETVEQWECWDGCPISYLNETVGITKSGHMNSMKKGVKRVAFSSYGVCRTTSQANEGYVSRFFKQIQATPDYIQASGDCICEICGETYYKHPTDGQLPFLTVLCNGDRAKL